MQFLSLGRSDEIGASCHYLSVGDRGLFLDAGADPNAEGEASLPNYSLVHEFFGATHPRDVYITHAHQDHIGGLPNLIDHFPLVRIRMTPATRMLLEFMLYSSARLQERRFREGSSAYPPIFDAEQVDDTLDMVQTHDYGVKIPHHSGFSSLTAEFCSAGHVLGSAGVLVTGPKGRRLYYTSDTNLQAQTIIPGAALPSQPIDILVMETTLGADAEAERTTRKEEEKRFCHALQEVLGRGGCALVPVFMLGRAQEVLAVIDRFKRTGQIADDIPIWTAGGLREVSRIYDATRNSTPRLNPDFEVYSVRQRNPPFKHVKLAKVLRKPGIFVVASGMLFENTLSNRLAQMMVEDEKHAILMVGFCKDNTPGGRLLEAVTAGDDGVILDRETGMQPLDCEVQRFRFSGHSNRQELVGLARKLRPKKTVLVHGETAARSWMAEAIRKISPSTELLLPEAGERVDL